MISQEQEKDLTTSKETHELIEKAEKFLGNNRPSFKGLDFFDNENIKYTFESINKPKAYTMPNGEIKYRVTGNIRSGEKLHIAPLKSIVQHFKFDKY